MTLPAALSLALCLAINGVTLVPQEKPPPPTTPQQEEQQPAEPPQSPEAKPWLEQLLGVPVRGSLSARYRFRATSDDHDQDLYEYLSSDVGDAQRHRLTAHMYLRATEDLDGDTSEDGFYVFDSITDTYGSELNARIYYAYLDLHRSGPVELARLGRQFLEETPVTFYFDGLRAQSEELEGLRGLRAGLYGGIPVHLFESSPGGDSIWGAWLEAKPWRGAHARVDYARVIDKYLLGTERSDLLGFGLSQRCSEKLRLEAHFDVLEGESHSLQLKSTYYESESDLQVQLGWYQLFETQRSLAIDVDSFFIAAQDYFPYWQLRLLLAKGFGRHLLVQAGADMRELEDGGDEGVLNHEFRRYYLTPSVTDWPWPRVSFSATFEWWEVPGSDNGDIRTLGFDVGWKASEQLRLAAGSSFAVYKFDYFDNIERENVRTYYAKATCQLKKDLKADLHFEYEDGDLEEFWTVKVGLTQSF